MSTQMHVVTSTMPLLVCMVHAYFICVCDFACTIALMYTCMPFKLMLYFMCLCCGYNEICTCTFLAAVSCGSAPDVPANGQRSGSGTTFGLTLTYTCNRGYNPPGAIRRTCMANRQWSGVTTRCTRKDIC